MNRSTRYPALAFVLLLGAGGCIAVGPDYEPVAIPLPATWSGDGAAASSATDRGDPLALSDERAEEVELPEVMDRWWDDFGDPTLTALVERAATGNLDVRTAGSRITQARASLGISEADQWPTIDGNVSATRSEGSEAVGTGERVDFYRAGIDVGRELDLFGGTHRSIEAAVADLEARHADEEAALVAISAEVALRYVDLREFQRRLDIAEDNLAVQEETFELTQFRAQAGLSTQLDVEFALSNLESTRARLPELEGQISRTSHAISVLLGLPPGSLDLELEEVAPIPTASPEIAVGVPAEVLRRRPDVRAAEQSVITQSALVGVATAQLYPRFRLGGSIGLESLSLDGLISTDVISWSSGPSINIPIFNRGRLRRGVDLQVALLEQSEIAYERTVLNALTEVEDALVDLRTTGDQQVAYADAAAAAQRAVDLSLDLYQNGVRDFQSVLEAQRSLYSFQDLQAQSEARGAASLVRLYKALGGAWPIE